MGAGDARPEAHTIAGLKWWQALIVFPTLLTSLGAAIPTVWQAFRAWRLDVAYSQVQQAEAQQRLWERNLECLSHKVTYAVDLDDGVTVAMTLCAGGDALLRYQVGDQTTYTWVPYPGYRAPARAPRLGEGQDPPARVRLVRGSTQCLRLTPPLVRGIRSLDGQRCTLEHILVASGMVVSEVPVPCDTACTP